MDEKELKTSPKQRFFIILIAILMVGSIVASYAAIVISGSQGTMSSTEASEIAPEKLAEYEAAYAEVQAEFKEATQGDFEKFMTYKSEIGKAYNENSANDGGVAVNDLKVGRGEEVKTDGTNYLAYYVGWCADETVFDSTWDDADNPTGFSKILDPSLGMIEGWNLGVEGMKVGGVREITIPGNLAYGEQMEICGGYSKPLKFVVMAKEKTDEMSTMAEKLDEANLRLQYAYYGIDYDQIKSNSE